MRWAPCYLDHLLFPRYPLHVDLVHPGKRGGRVILVRTPTRLYEVIREYDGYRHIYVELYPHSTIDKIVFDIDRENLGEALSDAWALCRALIRDNIPCIWLFSGRKGFHVYALVQPVRLEESTARLVVRSFQDYYAELTGVRIDRQLVGRVHAWIRYPNTIHPLTGRRAVYLEHRTYSIDEVLGLASQPSCPDVDLPPGLPDARGYVNLTPSLTYEQARPPSHPGHPVPDYIEHLIYDMLRPCIAHYALDEDPDHFIRTQMALELCWLGYSEEEIVNIIEKLHWADYKRHVTEYHVRKICEKARDGRLYPASCGKIRERGYCLGRQCPYYPSVFYWWTYLFTRDNQRRSRSE